MNKSKARRERKFNLDLYRKVQVEYAKAVRQLANPHRGEEALVKKIDHMLTHGFPADPGDGSRG